MSATTAELANALGRVTVNITEGDDVTITLKLGFNPGKLGITRTAEIYSSVAGLVRAACLKPEERDDFLAKLRMAYLHAKRKAAKP